MPMSDLSRPLLPALLAFESGIDPRRHDWYCRHLHQPAIRSAVVERPGRCRRDGRTGALVVEQMTVQQYFKSLGVDGLFNPTAPGSLSAMQYYARNALGFFGYQFGESALIRLGVYRPARARVEHEGREQVVDSYYSGHVPAGFWAEGRRAGLHEVDGTPIWATDVNTWSGTFTGRHGLWTYRDCLKPGRQDLLAQELLRLNLDALTRRLEVAGAALEEAMRERGADLSGALAGAHLCGPEAVAAYLLGGPSARDELGTTLEQYLARFADHQLPQSLGRRAA